VGVEHADEEVTMLKCHLTFRGEHQDEFGTPIPFHRYMILVSASDGGIANASAVSLSSEAPMPPLSTLGQKGDERDALEAMVKVLRELPGNATLREERTYDSGIA